MIPIRLLLWKLLVSVFKSSDVKIKTFPFAESAARWRLKKLCISAMETKQNLGVAEALTFKDKPEFFASPRKPYEELFSFDQLRLLSHFARICFLLQETEPVTSFV